MLTRNECRSLSFAIENCHIFRLGQVRKHFLYVCRLRDKTKVKNISQLTTPIGALLCKFRQTCFRVLSTQGCRYNKKAGVCC